MVLDMRKNLHLRSLQLDCSWSSYRLSGSPVQTWEQMSFIPCADSNLDILCPTLSNHTFTNRCCNWYYFTVQSFGRYELRNETKQKRSVLLNGHNVYFCTSFLLATAYFKLGYMYTHSFNCSSAFSRLTMPIPDAIDPLLYVTNLHPIVSYP